MLVGLWAAVLEVEGLVGWYFYFSCGLVQDSSNVILDLEWHEPVGFWLDSFGYFGLVCFYSPLQPLYIHTPALLFTLFCVTSTRYHTVYSRPFPDTV